MRHHGPVPNLSAPERTLQTCRYLSNKTKWPRPVLVCLQLYGLVIGCVLHENPIGRLFAPFRHQRRAHNLLGEQHSTRKIGRVVRFFKIKDQKLSLLMLSGLCET